MTKQHRKYRDTQASALLQVREQHSGAAAEAKLELLFPPKPSCPGDVGTASKKICVEVSKKHSRI